MLKIFPFKAFRYNTNKVRPNDVVVPPYDQIESAQISDYYAKSEYNFCRIIRGMAESSDNENNNPYTRADDAISRWISEGILVQDTEPGIYLYSQTYADVFGKIVTRNTMITLGELPHDQKSQIRPHERTLDGPKKDRLQLMRATRSALGLIFMLYSDASTIIDKMAFQVQQQPPAIAFTDSNSTIHHLWPITDKDKIDTFSNFIIHREVVIADGHHRYETALNYFNELKTADAPHAEAAGRTLMCFANTESKGLTIFPFHRAVHSLDFTAALLAGRLEDDFSVSEIAVDAINEESVKSNLLKMISDDFRSVYWPVKSNTAYLLSAPRVDLARKVKAQCPNRSAAWCELDVSILHTLILDKQLGIDEARCAQKTNLTYLKYIPEIVKYLNGSGNGIFLINSVKMEQIKAVVASGERMPQKSTNFFPKLLSGLTLYCMDR